MKRYQEDEPNELDKESYLLSVSSGNESYEYLQSVFKGFIWIFMFLISLFAIFLIFETPYYKYYEQEEPFLLREVEENELNEQVLQEDSILADLIIENIKEVESSDKRGIVDSRVDIEEELKKDLGENNIKNSSSKITELLKSTTSNIMDKISPKDDDKIAVSTVDPNDSLDNKDIMAGSERKITKLEELKRNQATYQRVWLINIFSTQDRSTLESRLNILQSEYPKLINYTIYFTEYLIGSAIHYRISIANKDERVNFPHFTTQEEASATCNILKKEKLDCFISAVGINSLERYKYR